ncbi:replication initiation protein [Photobacterium rosenbergii]|uniref:RepB family plasmid replication initiator protein n=1 Tax=Photobacterium rosenbergii TaxID=294936 RepID=A0A2T3N9V9_9GAMM|nr:replication initiation protein [Photobacterium rosenbergii]MBY5948417.1 replication initiation protein [Photobacterium rosenbergii]PSW10308.1 RepB family plasmid replication initiator protein [Photobacterium rosenbergii]
MEHVVSKDTNYPAIGPALPKHIKKGHQLVFSRQDLSAREADLFALMMAHMKEPDWFNNTPVYSFSCSQLSEWLEIDSRHVGSILSPVAERLSQRKVGIRGVSEKGDEEFDYIPFFKRLTYKDGKLMMIPNDELRTEYIEYNQGFALINTRNFFNLKKEYSKRLYELLSRFKTEGTTMKVQNIDDLKGLFGILDEKGKLKADKSSFKNNSVFMKRCIRDSIDEISTNPQTRKELLFLTSDKGEKGYRLYKQGRKIVGIEFLYRWLESGTVQELNLQAAKETIRKLEVKRLQSGEKLGIDELRLLADAYRAIDHIDTAEQIERSIAERQLEEVQNQQDSAQADEFNDMLAKIEALKEMGGNPQY